MRTAAFLLISGVIAALLLDLAARFTATVPGYVWGLTLMGCVALACLIYYRPVRLGQSQAAEGAGMHAGPHREKTLQAYAASVAKSLQSLYGRPCGFVLLTAPIEQSPPTVQYISNLERDDGTELLERLFSSWQEQAPGAGHRVRANSTSSPRILSTPLAGGSHTLEVPLEILDKPSSPATWQSQMLEFTHDAIIIWEMDGAGIMYWNRAAERLYGYDRTEVSGKVTHTLLKTVPSGNNGIDQLEKTLARYGVWVGELHHTGRDGRRIQVESRLALMSQEDGRWLVLEVNRDITDRRSAEDRSQAAEQQLSDLRSRVS